MSSESERRLSTEELKRLNQPSKAAPPPMVLLREADWEELLDRLDGLEASVGAQEALLRALTRQVGLLADRGPGPGCGPNAGSPATGWEEERAALLSAQIVPALHPLEQTVPGSGGSIADWGRAVGVVVQLGKDLEHISSDLPVRDATTMRQHGDRKLRQKERQKKIALGHKPDDHEDEIDLTLKGY